MSVKRLLPVALLLLVAAAERVLRAAPLSSDPAHALCGVSMMHPLGCALSGADLTSVLAYAVLRSAAIGIGCTVVCAAVGVALALLFEASSARATDLLRRSAELVQSVPGFLVALVLLATARHPSAWTLSLALCATGWAPFARLAVARILSLRDQAFVQAAYALGLPGSRVMAHHLAPNLWPVVAVQSGASASAFVLTETSLSFLGIGPTDGLSMGALLDAGVTSMFIAPHMLPVAAVTMVFLNLSLLSLGKAFGRV